MNFNCKCNCGDDDNLEIKETPEEIFVKKNKKFTSDLVKDKPKKSRNVDNKAYDFDPKKHVQTIKEFPRLQDRKKVILENNYFKLKEIKTYILVNRLPIYDYGKFIYQGEVSNGKIEGYGRMLDKNTGVYYEGEFDNDKYEGTGLRINEDDSYCFGTFSRGQLDGTNIIFKKLDGYTYLGEAVHDRLEGEAFIKYSSTEYYKGEVKKGLKKGQGQYFKDNELYKGEFKNDELNDTAGVLMVFDKGLVIKTYEGNFKHSFLNGAGKITFPQGNIFEGLFRNNKREGKGYLTEKKTGKIYGGVWSNDVLNGEGTITSNGYTIKVRYQNGKVSNN